MVSLKGMNGEVGLFCRWANSAARYVGSATAFGAATGMVIVWGLTGPFVEFSDTWQLIINGNNDHHVSHGIFDPKYAEP